MVRRSTAALDAFEADPAGRGGAGHRRGRARRSAPAATSPRSTTAGKAGASLGQTFWRDEYRLDAAASPLPEALCRDHGRHRHGRRRRAVGPWPPPGRRPSARASPCRRPAIGFFPDVGGTWLLPRCPGEIGTYLGLTGAPHRAPPTRSTPASPTFRAAAELAGLVQALAALRPKRAWRMCAERCNRRPAGRPAPLRRQSRPRSTAPSPRD